MRQELTILLDSFRLLSARRLFWVALAISMLVATLYASIGFNERGMTVFFGAKEYENPILRAGRAEASAFYLLLFTDVIIRWWLAWIAVALALLSTASIFPDFLAEGSIGISLSKPIGRLRLFFWKFVGGLLFVALQVGLFSLIVFLALGLRIGEWNFTVFWAVPLVTFVFSLIYCVAVLFGVWTRSTLFALLAAFLVWGASLLAQWTENFLYQTAHLMPEMGMQLDFSQGDVTEVVDGEGEKESSLVAAHRTARMVAAPLPKTRDTVTYLKRLIRIKERQSALAGMSFDSLLTGHLPSGRDQKAMKRHDERHSLGYVFGTSLAFELGVLSLAAWRFCRRDY